MKVLNKIKDAFKFLWRHTDTRVWLMVSSVLTALLLVISVVVTQVGIISGTLNIVFGGERAVLGDFDGERQYIADYKTKAQAVAAANEFTVAVEEEGIVLLKNEDNALPLDKGSRISVFGKNSVNMVYGGSGSSVGQGEMTDLYTSLERAEFEVNKTLKSFYENSNKSGAGRADNPGMGDKVFGFATGETPLASYSATEWGSCNEYKDAAIMVVSRIGGEGFDLPRTMYVSESDSSPVAGAGSASDHYLELDANEKALLKELYSRFDKVIILLNTPGSFELNFAENTSSDLYSSKLKGIMWIGFPGTSGMLAVGRVLNGEVNPSGHTTDTYAADFLASPAVANFGTNNVDGANRYYYIDEKGKRRNSGYFVDYEEGIYVGYRYYETRGYGDDEWYAANVVYPFGYGLSYSDFDWKVISAPETALTADGTISVTVEVTNRADSTFAGKDVVQLYYTPPYTPDGIEKSHIVLGGFAKTKLLQPGEKDTVTIEMKVEDMKSYDYSDANGNGNRGYELEAGTYTVHVARNAHDFAESYACTLAQSVNYKTDGATGVNVENLFDEVSGHIETYLSRNGWTGMPTTPTEAEREVTKEFHQSLSWTKDDEGKPWYTDVMKDTNKNYGLKLAFFVGIDYSDNKTKFTEEKLGIKSSDEGLSEKKIADNEAKKQLLGKTYAEGWELLLDQLSAEDMATMIGSGAFTTIALDKVGKPKTNDSDGPSGITSFMASSPTGTCTYAAESVLGATWNIELAFGMGVALGNEALVATRDGLHYTGWYAPAANIHRTPFGGRNWEYYSEDGFISGKMAAEVIKGCKTKGVYCYMKHFAVNDQETNRDSNGLITWANEQCMREIYFKPFEIAVKEGGATAMMSSFNRIGTVWAGGDYRLLTKVLRDEWGFKGMVIDDYGLTDYINQEQVIRAGGDLMLIQGQKIPEYQNADATQLACLRNATKHILYTVANSNIMEYNIVGMLLPVWVVILIVADCAAVAAFALWGVLVIRKTLKKKASATEAEPESADEPDV